MKLPFLAGTVAFAVVGIAVAAQGNAFFIPDANQTASAPMGSTAISAGVPETPSIKVFSPAETVSQIAGDTSAIYSPGNFIIPPTGNLPAADSNPLNTNQIVRNSVYAANSHYLNDGLGNWFDGKLGGGGPGGGFSSPFGGNINGYMFYAPMGQSGNAYGPWTWTFYSGGNPACCWVAAVPEPDAWWLMLLGLGMVGFIARFHS